MTYELAMRLRNLLQLYCPVDTGQLRLSIQPVHHSASGWIIVIGTDNGSINGTPSNQYAAFTNNAKTINFKGRSYPNPNFHWANRAIERWAKESGFQILLEHGGEEDE